MTFGKHAVELFGTPGATLPGRFRKYAWDVDVGFHPGGFFDVLENLALQVFQVPYRQFELKLSTPERAVLELIHQSDVEMLFSSVADVLNGLTTLSPRRVQNLLEACSSIRKVERRLICLCATCLACPLI